MGPIKLNPGETRTFRVVLKFNKLPVGGTKSLALSSPNQTPNTNATIPELQDAAAFETLSVYKDYLDEHYPHAYAADYRPVKGVILAYEDQVNISSPTASNYNPYGWSRTTTRYENAGGYPNDVGLSGAVNYVKDVIEVKGWDRVMVWAASGVAPNGNYPVRTVSHWTEPDRIWITSSGATFTIPNNMDNGATAFKEMIDSLDDDKKIGFWFGQSSAHQPGFGGYSIPAGQGAYDTDLLSRQLEIVNKMTTNLAGVSKGMIGLDAWHPSNAPNNTNYFVAEQFRNSYHGMYDGVIKFITESRNSDYMHRRDPTFHDLFNGVTKVKMINGSFGIANYLSPNHETWVGCNWFSSDDEALRGFGGNPNRSHERDLARGAEIRKLIDMGLVPVVYDEIDRSYIYGNGEGGIGCTGCGCCQPGCFNLQGLYDCRGCSGCSSCSGCSTTGPTCSGSSCCGITSNGNACWNTFLGVYDCEGCSGFGGCTGCPSIPQDPCDSCDPTITCLNMMTGLIDCLGCSGCWSCTGCGITAPATGCDLCSSLSPCFTVDGVYDCAGCSGCHGCTGCPQGPTGATGCNLCRSDAPCWTLSGIYDCQGCSGCFGCLGCTSLPTDPCTVCVNSQISGLTGWASNTQQRLTPPAGLTNVTQVACGANHTYVLKTDGTVSGWGRNFEGQRSTPAGLNNVTQVACGANHTYVLKTDGTVTGWGQNTNGQRNTPAGLNNVTQIACGNSHTYALKNDGTLIGWGLNTERQIDTPAGLTNVTQVACGALHTYALKNDGTLVGWGSTAYGQTVTPAGLTNVTQVACGANHTYARKGDGTLVGWGGGGPEQSGFPHYGQTVTPAGLTNVTQVACGWYYTYALKTDGTVTGWGDNTQGQINTPAGLNNVTQIACGGYHTYALSTVNPLSCFNVVSGIYDCVGCSGCFSCTGCGITGVSAGATSCTGSGGTACCGTLDSGSLCYNIVTGIYDCVGCSGFNGCTGCGIIESLTGCALCSQENPCFTIGGIYDCAGCSGCWGCLGCSITGATSCTGCGCCSTSATGGCFNVFTGLYDCEGCSGCFSCTGCPVTGGCAVCECCLTGGYNKITGLKDCGCSGCFGFTGCGVTAPATGCDRCSEINPCYTMNIPTAYDCEGCSGCWQCTGCPVIGPTCFEAQCCGITSNGNACWNTFLGVYDCLGCSGFGGCTGCAVTGASAGPTGCAACSTWEGLPCYNIVTGLYDCEGCLGCHSCTGCPPQGPSGSGCTGCECCSTIFECFTITGAYNCAGCSGCHGCNGCVQNYTSCLQCTVNDCNIGETNYDFCLDCGCNTTYENCNECTQIDCDTITVNTNFCRNTCGCVPTSVLCDECVRNDCNGIRCRAECDECIYDDSGRYTNCNQCLQGDCDFDSSINHQFCIDCGCIQRHTLCSQCTQFDCDNQYSINNQFCIDCGCTPSIDCGACVSEGCVGQNCENCINCPKEQEYTNCGQCLPADCIYDYRLNHIYCLETCGCIPDGTDGQSGDGPPFSSVKTIGSRVAYSDFRKITLRSFFTMPVGPEFDCKNQNTQTPPVPQVKVTAINTTPVDTPEWSTDTNFVVYSEPGSRSISFNIEGVKIESGSQAGLSTLLYLSYYSAISLWADLYVVDQTGKEYQMASTGPFPTSANSIRILYPFINPNNPNSEPGAITLGRGIFGSPFKFRGIEYPNTNCIYRVKLYFRNVSNAIIPGSETVKEFNYELT